MKAVPQQRGAFTGNNSVVWTAGCEHTTPIILKGLILRACVCVLCGHII